MKKYTAKVIAREYLTISNETCQPIVVSSDEKLMDAIYGNKYSLVELNRSLGVITAKTKTELNDKAWELAEKNHNFDIEVFIIK